MLLNKFYIFKPRQTQAEVMTPSLFRMFILPSYFGLFFLILMVILLLWVTNHQLNLGYALLFFVFFSISLSALLTIGICSRLKFSVHDATPGFVGDTAFFPLDISELSQRQRSGFWLKNGSEKVFCEGVAVSQTVQIMLPQGLKSRGWQSLTAPSIYTTLPLGLFVTWRRLDLKAKVLVYPKPFGDMPLPLTLHFGEYHALIENHAGDFFSGLATHQWGQPLSKMAWKQSLRGTLMTKDFSAQGGQKIILDIASLTKDKESNLSQLCQWIIQCENLGLSYALKLGKQFVDFSNGPAHRDYCLQLLALY